ncbi:MAG: 50S ribosomal protein L29 [Candidatus Azosocius agrarius]|nr:MAG: 50S ribosomal protein L29 [Gammaproteobacteria bacterium]
MKAQLLKHKTKEELIVILNGLLRERLKYNICRATGEFTKFHLFSKTSKNIAKICTVINEKKKSN